MNAFALPTVALVASVVAWLTAAIAIAVSWRAWRRQSLLRFHFDRSERERAQLEHAVDGLRKSVALLRSEAVLRTRDTPNALPVQLLSQHSEDALASELLGESRDGFFIEAGAHDGLTFSNSYFLESLGWRGLLVEAHPELVARCRETRPGSTVVHAALGGSEASGSRTFQMVRGSGGVDALSFSHASSYQVSRVQLEGGRLEPVDVPYTSLDRLLGEAPPARVDFFSLDVEGAELEVLRGFNLRRWRPRLLLIEDNTGGSDSRVSDYLARFGYRRCLRHGGNDFYVPVTETASG